MNIECPPQSEATFCLYYKFPNPVFDSSYIEKQMYQEVIL